MLSDSNVTIAGYTFALRALGYYRLADMVQAERWQATRISWALTRLSLNRRRWDTIAFVLLVGGMARHANAPERHSPEPELTLAKAALRNVTYWRRPNAWRETRDKARALIEQRLGDVMALAAKLAPCRHDENVECEGEPTRGHSDIHERVNDLAGHGLAP
jgi:hypothetical protein